MEYCMRMLVYAGKFMAIKFRFTDLSQSASLLVDFKDLIITQRLKRTNDTVHSIHYYVFLLF